MSDEKPEKPVDPFFEELNAYADKYLSGDPEFAENYENHRVLTSFQNTRDINEAYKRGLIDKTEHDKRIRNAMNVPDLAFESMEGGPVKRMLTGTAGSALQPVRGVSDIVKTVTGYEPIPDRWKEVQEKFVELRNEHREMVLGNMIGDIALGAGLGAALKVLKFGNVAKIAASAAFGYVTEPGKLLSLDRALGALGWGGGAWLDGFIMKRVGAARAAAENARKSKYAVDIYGEPGRPSVKDLASDGTGLGRSTFDNVAAETMLTLEQAGGDIDKTLAASMVQANTNLQVRAAQVAAINSRHASVPQPPDLPPYSAQEEFLKGVDDLGKVRAADFSTRAAAEAKANGGKLEFANPEDVNALTRHLDDFDELEDFSEIFALPNEGRELATQAYGDIAAILHADPTGGAKTPKILLQQAERSFDAFESYMHARMPHGTVLDAQPLAKRTTEEVANEVLSLDYSTIAAHVIALVKKFTKTATPAQAAQKSVIAGIAKAAARNKDPQMLLSMVSKLDEYMKPAEGSAKVLEEVSKNGLERATELYNLIDYAVKALSPEQAAKHAVAMEATKAKIAFSVWRARLTGSDAAMFALSDAIAEGTRLVEGGIDAMAAAEKTVTTAARGTLKTAKTGGKGKGKKAAAVVEPAAAGAEAPAVPAAPAPAPAEPVAAAPEPVAEAPATEAAATPAAATPDEAPVPAVPLAEIAKDVKPAVGAKEAAALRTFANWQDSLQQWIAECDAAGVSKQDILDEIKPRIAEAKAKMLNKHTKQSFAVLDQIVAEMEKTAKNEPHVAEESMLERTLREAGEAPKPEKAVLPEITPVDKAASYSDWLHSVIKFMEAGEAAPGRRLYDYQKLKAALAEAKARKFPDATADDYATLESAIESFGGKR